MMTDLGHIQQNVYASLASITDREVQQLHDEQPIIALGISSHLMVDLLMSLEQAFSLAIPEAKLYQCSTVGDVCRLIAELQQERE